MATGTSVLKLVVDDRQYEASLKDAKRGMQDLQDSLQRAGKTFNDCDKAMADYARGLGQMETTSKTAKGRVGELQSAFVEISTVYRRMTDEEKQSPFGQATAAGLEQLRGRALAAKQELVELNRQLEAADGGGVASGRDRPVAVGDMLGKLGGKFGISSDLLNGLTKGTVAYTAAIGAAATAVAGATKAWADYNSELSKQDNVVRVTTGLDDSEVSKMTDTVRALSDTYNVDFRDAVNAANILMTQFGKSGDEALQLLRDGLQGMIAGDGPKLLSMIQQYAPAFRDAGVSASQLVAVIQNSEGGIFTDQNMNAIVMGIKNIRLMTKATSEALGKMGIDGEKMSKQLSDGSLTVFEALKQVASQLRTVDSNSQTAGEVMQQVFGRQGVTAGTNLATAIETLNTDLEETKKQTGDLGESFSELQRANERLNSAMRDAFGYDGWEQMATGIKATLVTALSAVVEKLGDIRASLNDMPRPTAVSDVQERLNSTGGKQTRVDRMVSRLGDGQGERAYSLYQRQVDAFVKREERLKFLIAANSKDSDAMGRGRVQKLQEELQAVKNLHAEYEKRAKDLHNQRSTEQTDIKNTINSTNETVNKTTVNKVTKSTAEKTETQVNTQAIEKLTSEYLKLGTAEKEATDEQRAAIEKRKAGIRDEIQVLKERNKKLKRMADEANGLRIDDSSVQGLTRKLQELRTAQQEAADGKAWREYEDKIKRVSDRLAVMKGQLPKGQEAEIKVEVTAEGLELLRGLTVDDKTIHVNVEEGRVELPDVPADDKTIHVNVEEGRVELPDVPADDKTIHVNVEEGRVELPDVLKEDEKTITVNVTATSSEGLREVLGLIGDDFKEVEIRPKMSLDNVEQDVRSAFEQLQDNIRLEIAAKNIEVDKNALKSLTEVVTKYDIKTGSVDMQQVMGQTEALTEAGMAAGEAYQKALRDALSQNIDLSSVLQQIGEQVNIPDETWTALQDSINEKLKELNVEPIKIDLKTGGVTKQAKEMTNNWQSAAQAIQQVGSAMQGIEDPAAKVMGTIAQAIATIALGYAQATTQAASMGPWAWVAFAATGLATMISSISAIHSATGFAEGGMVQGNTYSMDQVPAMLNAGEVVLNKAQQGALASQLQDGGGGGFGVSHISGEQIWVALNRYAKRTGRGELVTWR